MTGEISMRRVASTRKECMTTLLAVLHLSCGMTGETKMRGLASATRRFLMTLLTALCPQLRNDWRDEGERARLIQGGIYEHLINSSLSSAEE